jgi:hypothetical protein
VNCFLVHPGIEWHGSKGKENHVRDLLRIYLSYIAFLAKQIIAIDDSEILTNRQYRNQTFVAQKTFNSLNIHGSEP